MTVLIQDVQTLLLTLAPAGGVWYGLNTTQPPAYPYLVHFRAPSPANVGLRGVSALQNTRWQISIYAIKLIDAVAIEVALEAAFVGWSAINTPLMSWDAVDPDTKAIRIVKEYSIWSAN